CRYAIADSPFSVPADVQTTDLSALINKLLNADKNEDDICHVNFDFLINGEFLRVPLGKHMEESSFSTETVVDIEYLEKFAAPKPVGSIVHDDWVSSLQGCQDCIVSGSYDKSVRVWTVDGKNIITMSHHTEPVKAVAWIKKVFVLIPQLSEYKPVSSKSPVLQIYIILQQVIYRIITFEHVGIIQHFHWVFGDLTY
ncbi:ribosome biogenesis protein WDR12-like, partial [Saccoglossus kowalevskii]